MPYENKKFQNNQDHHAPRQPRQSQHLQPQVEELEEDSKWNPTPEVFEVFLVRDEKLCTGNLHMVLSSVGRPISFRELKDSTLHSADVIEQVLTSGIAAGLVLENKGKYTLAPRTAR